MAAPGIDTSYRHLSSSPTGSRHGNEEEESLLPRPTSSPSSDYPVFTLIHNLRLLIISHIDVYHPHAALSSPPLSYTLIRPLQAQLPKKTPALLYALLLNRVQFLKEEEEGGAGVGAGVCKTRANVAELLAVRSVEEWTGGGGWESGGRGLETCSQTMTRRLQQN
ncbi:hypothetical protein BT69DRAFT_939315 [Atractiella rhizophila]|nr:hypothetical protein BT69DRAFT_939315 [Atractiella rhizophila]